MCENNYPEQLGISFVVHAPWAFTAVWSVMKAWINEDTRAKIKFVSGSPFKELVKYIDEDNIPDFYGGKCTKPLIQEHGPWNAFEIVDGSEPGDIVGIRKIDEP